MGILSRIPGVGKLSEYKRTLKGVAFVQGMNVIKTQYKKAESNYKVLAMGLDSGMPIPKVVRKCERFYKDNRKDWKKYLGKEPVEFTQLEDLFRRIKENSYGKEDAVWLNEKWLPLFKRISSAAELHWANKTV